MKNIWTILKRELGSYFNSAIAYIYLIVFVAINNILFMSRFFLSRQCDMRVYFDTLPLVLFIFIPALTMRLWSEDKKGHTFELLMTLPMRPYQLVMGKFLAGFIFYAVSLLCTLTIPLILYLTGRPDWGAIIGGYLGNLLLGMLFLAIGIFVSGLTSEQILAFILAVLSTFLIFFLGAELIIFTLDGWIPGLGTFLSNYLGCAGHLKSFAKGVIDFKDIIYFIVTSFCFIFLNGLFLEGRLRPRVKIVFSTAVAACLLGTIALNWLLLDLPVARIDLTESKIYTTSPAARRILNNLKSPVMVNFYISPADKMPAQFKSLEAEITGKLEEIKVVSAGKFIFKVTHVEAGEPEQTLASKGVVPFQVESIDRDELNVRLIYSALTISYKEKKEEALPRVALGDISSLEYHLFSRIVKLSQDKKPIIALYSAQDDNSSPRLAVQGNEDKYKIVQALLKENGYEVRKISLNKGDPLTADFKTLLILNPLNLNDRQVYEINKFLYQGGSVLIAAQGYDYTFQMGQGGGGINVIPQRLSLDINRLLRGWGASVNEEMFFYENSQIVNISTGEMAGPFAISVPVKVPNQILVSTQSMNRDIPLMARVSPLLYLWGSSLDISEDTLKNSGLKKSILFTSGLKSWKAPHNSQALESSAFIFPKGTSSGKFPLAVMLEGKFSNTFTGKDIPDWPSAEGQALVKKNNVKTEELISGSGKLILVGCARMFSNDLVTNPGNLGFFAGMVDGLTLGEDIISLPSSAYLIRDIKKVSDVEKVIYKFLAIFLIPIILVIIAAVRFFIRRREKYKI